METEVKTQKIAKFNQLKDRFNGLVLAGRIQSETHVRTHCVNMMFQHVWDFTPGFGETGSFTEEDELAAGTTKVKADNTLHSLNGKVVVEVKGPQENLDSHIPQLASYAKLTNGCVVAIITNGTEWRIFLVSRSGEMLERPFKVIDLRTATDEDAEFMVSLFDPKYTVNVSTMRQAQTLREKQEAEEKKFNFFRDALKEFTEKPSDEWIKDKIRQFEGIASVSAQKLEDYKRVTVTAAVNALRDEISKDAVEAAQRNSNKQNRVFAGEYAIGNGARVFCKSKGISLAFHDDDDARISHLEETTSGRKVLWIVGDVSEETGWSLRGICFPNRTKGRGTIIPVASVEAVDDYFGLIAWVAENISRPTEEWASLFEERFASVT